MTTKATAKYVGTSTRKIGLVAGLIRGLSVLEAKRMLAATDKRATNPVGKVLDSALANAENNYNAKKADLFIESVLVGPAPMLKRFRPRSRGAAGSIKKRASHITVILTDQKDPGTRTKELANNKEVIPKAPAQSPETTRTKKPAAKKPAKVEETK
jgi:large subunit ribosomal protein L22